MINQRRYQGTRKRLCIVIAIWLSSARKYDSTDNNFAAENDSNRIEDNDLIAKRRWKDTETDNDTHTTHFAINFAIKWLILNESIHTNDELRVRSTTVLTIN